MQYQIIFKDSKHVIKTFEAENDISARKMFDGFLNDTVYLEYFCNFKLVVAPWETKGNSCESERMPSL